jgi:hypothetical protein
MLSNLIPFYNRGGDASTTNTSLNANTALNANISLNAKVSRGQRRKRVFPPFSLSSIIR